MKFFILLTLAVTCFYSCAKQNTFDEGDKFVADLLGKMTIEEKVGQMTQLTLSVFMKEGKVQDSLLEKYIVNYGIGSMLNVMGPGPSSVSEWQTLIKRIQDVALSAPNKIPVLYGIDAIHGATYTKNSVLFPHNIGIAASRNIDLTYQSAKATVAEVRSAGIRWNFDPVFGVAREPLWSRFEETFGEDSYLVGEFGTAVIRGYEDEGLKNKTAVASCIKHYLGYSMPAIGKDRTPAYISDIMFHEIFLPPFKKAIETGAKTVMVNSGSINGVPVHASKKLLTGLLKEKLGFKGLVVTDWEDILFLYREHKVAHNNREAVKIAVNAGIDMSMVPEDVSFYTDLVDLVKSGEVSMERINDAVTRILKVKYDVGLFDNAYAEEGAADMFGKPKFDSLAYTLALESITLLKNDTLKSKPVLPIKSNANVLVTGPAANILNTLHGSWSYTWQGEKENLYPERILTIKEAIQDKLGAKNVQFAPVKSFMKTTPAEIKTMQRKAAQADYLILCLGEKSYAEGHGNIDELDLPQSQIAIAKAAYKTGKPVIVVLTQGRPLIVREIVDQAAGIVLAYRPGNRGADAIADILSGSESPSGKLPFTYHKHSGNIVMYDAPKRCEKHYRPQWPFGFGLSYTQFEYDDIKLNTTELSTTGTLEIKVEITNIGNRDSKLGVDLFISDEVARIIPPMKKLRGFQKVFIKSGETKTVEFSITKDDLAFVNDDLQRVTEEGKFIIMLGDKQAEFYYFPDKNSEENAMFKETDTDKII
ncbi:glycoside hydrolase family 3 C-terminal domain-containing protein [Bacteroidales bacterium]|nr:glycoside hydrolase family 3 C-terminal domain-containing protein [Bacteroidales bacterium]